MAKNILPFDKYRSMNNESLTCSHMSFSVSATNPDYCGKPVVAATFLIVRLRSDGERSRGDYSISRSPRVSEHLVVYRLQKHEVTGTTGIRLKSRFATPATQSGQSSLPSLLSFSPPTISAAGLSAVIDRPYD